MNTDVADEHFGCRICWTSDAALAYAAFSELDIESRLVDESHFGVTTRACRKCSQYFLSVFTETIDWIDGEDPQYHIIIPITESEMDGLMTGRSSNTEAELNAIGSGRRSLHHDYPKDGQKRVFWSSGIWVGPHD